MSHLRSFVSLVLAMVVAPISWASIESPAQDLAAPLITSSQFIVSGEVVGRTEVGLTVVDRNSQLTTVIVNQDTTITKGAESIKLSEVMVGDKVNITIQRGGDGKLQAVAVAVHTGYE
jgi:hypothetical protein